MKNILKHNNKIYTQDDLIKALYDLGIKNGDIVCAHSEIFNFGIPLLSINEFLSALIESLFEVIGKDGTLLMPTFTYSFCNNEVYDKVKSKTAVGALNDFFRKQEGVKRTNDPIFSFAIKGAREELFLNKDCDSCFGNDCTYEILTYNNGKILNFGNKECYTFVHYPEESCKISYRYNKIFKGLIIDENNNQYEKQINFFVRHQGVVTSDEKITQFLKLKDYYNEIKFGNTSLALIEARKFYDDLMVEFKKNESIFRIDQ
ncbi:AAC(3) family N-acetyltransferase [Campylobacter armoricus]|uniref:AAC(3) family N-acetyltransferase n=1 Tax=Campylobacter armoricus TaxID=2505970 RepID=UPI0011175EE6|nr:AAC(3) family N-acetyltransferase [Campylobacter armoricus]